MKSSEYYIIKSFEQFWGCGKTKRLKAGRARLMRPSSRSSLLVSSLYDRVRRDGRDGQVRQGWQWHYNSLRSSLHLQFPNIGKVPKVGT